jgi:hypothetical protein
MQKALGEAAQGCRTRAIRALVLGVGLCCNAVQHLFAAVHNGVSYEHSKQS